MHEENEKIEQRVDPTEMAASQRVENGKRFVHIS